ncbi:hypothetical protein [Rhizobium sp. NPDC090279]|uniref:hypothetical protein n=1 Tax=Rhizobium sp. NPDC090279 TaxID=3364499 RepID=UPI00383A3256
MIWFDAALEYPADDELLERCVAAVLSEDVESVDIVHGIENMQNAPITCVVHDGSPGEYSQLVTIYLSEDFRQPDIIESGARLAQLLERSLLLANDATTDPFSFIFVSKTGARSMVSVDADELDRNDRYRIVKPDDL